MNSCKADRQNSMTPSIADSLARLCATISLVNKKLANYKTDIIFKKQLEGFLKHIASELRGNILDRPLHEVAKLLKEQANAMDSYIKHVYSEPSPAFVALAFALITSIILGILELVIALSVGITISGLIIVVPLVGGLAWGVFCFFTAVDAQKQRMREQDEMRTIITAINQLADVILHEVNEDSEAKSSLAFDL